MREASFSRVSPAGVQQVVAPGDKYGLNYGAALRHESRRAQTDRWMTAGGRPLASHQLAACVPLACTAAPQKKEKANPAVVSDCRPEELLSRAAF